MVKKNLLKAKIVENETNYTECAEALNVSRVTFSSKMNGHTAFNIEQAKLLSNYLNLTHNEKINIFLS